MHQALSTTHAHTHTHTHAWFHWITLPLLKWLNDIFSFTFLSFSSIMLHLCVAVLSDMRQQQCIFMPYLILLFSWRPRVCVFWVLRFRLWEVSACLFVACLLVKWSTTWLISSHFSVHFCKPAFLSWQLHLLQICDDLFLVLILFLRLKCHRNATRLLFFFFNVIVLGKNVSSIPTCH